MERHGYRGDIDGLRAIAVLGVVAYHAVPGIVQGGFTGVDVFFVISGFLITQIIATELRSDRFSFTNFYARRVRRIFPALLIALAATAAIGWRTLYSSEFEQVGKHVAGGAAFISNLVLQNEAGYFDYGSDRKPLLHLWSLGVEEQFYLIWPLVLVVAWRLSRRLDVALTAVFTLSFIASVIASQTNATAAFYFPLFRFWELACGGLLAVSGASLARTPRLARASGFAGITLIAIGILVPGSRAHYSSWLLLLPTAGACLVLAAGPANAANKVLAIRPLVAIGLISYPLYLWHWPLLVFARILDGPLPSRQLRAVLVVASFGLASLTYFLAERPIRASRATRPVAAALLILMMLMGGGGYAIYASGGAPARAVARAAAPFIATMEQRASLTDCFDLPDPHRRINWYCHLNPSGTPARTMVFGDSHALALLPAFEAIAKQSGEDILFTGISGCPPLLGVIPRLRNQDVADCRALNERVFQFTADRQLADLFLVGNWTYYTDGNYAGENLNVIGVADTPVTREGSREAFRRGLALTVARYGAQRSMAVHLVQKVPAQLRDAIDLIRDVVTSAERPEQSIARISVPIATHHHALEFVNAEFAAQGITTNAAGHHVDLIDLDSAYCLSAVCAFGAPGVSYYFDNNHLSASGALLAVPLLSRHLEP